MSALSKLAELGLQLPAVAAPVAAYVPALRVADQVWTSGQLPLVDGSLTITGKLGGGVCVEDGKRAAQICALNALAAVAAQLDGGLDAIQRIVKLTVFVASEPTFTQQPQVANGASELMQELFGDTGAHVRSAVGVSVLPLDAPVEVELVAQV